MESSIPWIEKFRPMNIEDIILDDQVSQQIKIFLDDRKNVHLILTGAPGVGKTSVTRCIARRVLGDNMSQGYLELNAAEDRGVRSISTIIPPFCKRIVDFEESKIILLDEADNMTAKCQYDINDMIKIYGNKTKFIFTCNDSTKIIEDIQSVCRIIRFKKLTDDNIGQYLRKICDSEKIEYNDSGLSTICYISNGDMRKAINNLQLTAYSYNKINKKTVLKICKIPDPEEIKNIIEICLQCKLKKNDTKLVEANNCLENIISQGYYCLDIVTSFIYVLTTYQMKEDLKLKLIDVINQTKIAISTGLRSKLQLTAMIGRIILTINQYENHN